MNRTSYRQRARLSSSASSPDVLREDPPAYLAPFAGPDPEDERLAELFHYLQTLESAPTSTLARQLLADGIELPPPDAFTEESVHHKLWEVIRGMARRRHFLYSTDHLSNLELYRHLWEVTLNEPNYELDDRMGDCACHIDLVSDGSDRSIRLWLRYYADELTREDWKADFPDEEIPEPAPLPYDRDRYLPQRFPGAD